MQQFFRHEAILAVPAAKPGDAWTAPEPLRSAADLRAVLDSGASAGRLAAQAGLEREILYNRARPTRIAWWVLTLSLLLSDRRDGPRRAAPSTSRRAPCSSPGSRS